MVKGVKKVVSEQLSKSSIDWCNFKNIGDIFSESVTVNLWTDNSKYKNISINK